MPFVNWQMSYGVVKFVISKPLNNWLWSLSKRPLFRELSVRMVERFGHWVLKLFGEDKLPFSNSSSGNWHLCKGRRQK